MTKGELKVREDYEEIAEARFQQIRDKKEHKETDYFKPGMDREVILVYGIVENSIDDLEQVYGRLADYYDRTEWPSAELTEIELYYWDDYGIVNYVPIDFARKAMQEAKNDTIINGC